MHEKLESSLIMHMASFLKLSELHNLGCSNKYYLKVSRDINYWRQKFYEELLPVLCPNGLNPSWPIIFMSKYELENFYLLFRAFFHFDSCPVGWWREFPVNAANPAGNLFCCYVKGDILQIDRVAPHNYISEEYIVTYRNPIGFIAEKGLKDRYLIKVKDSVLLLYNIEESNSEPIKKYHKLPNVFYGIHNDSFPFIRDLSSVSQAQFDISFTGSRSSGHEYVNDLFDQFSHILGFSIGPYGSHGPELLHTSVLSANFRSFESNTCDLELGLESMLAQLAQSPMPTGITLI